MMSERGEPRWELLPHDPVGFFELAEPFDRKTLKQRYTDLVRRFKPEKHPSEFQRIRAAFESARCEVAIRATRADGPGGMFAIIGPRTRPRQIHPRSAQASRTSALHASSRFTAKRNQALSLVRRLESEEPTQLYEELERRESKSAYDYYALAVLADLSSRGRG